MNKSDFYYEENLERQLKALQQENELLKQALLKDRSARWRWCKKRKVALNEDELQKNLQKLKDTLCFMDIFIERR